MSEFLMPILGADMQSGTLVAWKKQPGDRVERGDIIAEVETDKADVEVEIFMTGTLAKILVEPGTKVPVGTPLAVIAEEGAPAAPAAPAPAAAPLPSAPPPRRAARPAGPQRPALTPTGERLRVSPSARQLAVELHVDLTTVAGTGPGGRIMRRDIEQAAERAAPPPATPPAAADRQARMRQAIAAAMTRSAREIPHFHLSTTIDMSRAMAWLSEENERKPIADRILYGALLIKAVAVALREVPEFNAVWDGDHVRVLPAVHVGVAISLRGGGLVAPAMHDTDQRPLDALMKDFRDLAKRVRAGSLRSSEISDPTITITSLGEAGAESVFGLIYPPQVALVGFGRITERVVAVNGAVLVHPVISATLSADHRVADGHRGSLFLAAIDRLLQEPAQL